MYLRPLVHGLDLLRLHVLLQVVLPGLGGGLQRVGGAEGAHEGVVPDRGQVEQLEGDHVQPDHPEQPVPPGGGPSRGRQGPLALLGGGEVEVADALGLAAAVVGAPGRGPLAGVVRGRVFVLSASVIPCKLRGEGIHKNYFCGNRVFINMPPFNCRIIIYYLRKIFLIPVTLTSSPWPWPS